MKYVSILGFLLCLQVHLGHKVRIMLDLDPETGISVMGINDNKGKTVWMELGD